MKGTLLWPHLILRTRVELQATVQRVLSGRQPLRYDMQWKDRWYDLCLTPSLSPSGAVLSVAMVGWDITERRRTAEGLRAFSHYTRSLIEVSPDPLVLTSAEGRISDVNEASVQATGIPRERLVGTDFSNCFVEPEKARAGYQRVFSHGSVRDYPLAIRHASGRVTEVLYNATLYRDALGQVMGVFAVARDISERARAEAKLRESERRLKRAHQVAGLGNWEWELATNQLYWAEENYRIHGLDSEQVKPSYEAFIQIVDPAERDYVNQTVADALAGRNSFEIDYTIIRPDNGERRIIHSKADVFMDDAGKAVRMVGTVQDITERKRVEQELRAATARLNEAQEIANVGSFVYDTATNHVAYSVQLKRILGLGPDDQETPASWNELLHGEDRGSVEAALADCIQRGVPYDMEYRITRRSDGQTRWLRGIGKAELDPTGKVVRINGVNIDRTQRRGMEQAFRDSEERYRRLFEVESDAILLVERETKAIFDANPAALQLYGYTRQEFLRLRQGDLSAEPEKSGLAMDDGQTFIPLRWHCKHDGSVFPVEISGDYFEAGGQKLHVAVIRDITERRRAESLLRRSEEQLRAIIESSPVAMAVNDEHDNMTYLNRRFVETFGYTLADIPTVAAWWPRAYPDPAYRQRVAKEWQAATEQAHREGSALQLEDYQVTCKDGSVRSIRFSLAPIGASHVVILYDITELKRAEEALRQSACTSEVLRDCIVAINACPDLEAALACLVHKAVDAGGMDCGAAYLLDGQDAVLRYSVGLPPEFVKQVARRPLSTYYIQTVLEHPLEIYNLEERFPDWHQLGQGYGLQHVYCLGLVVDQYPFGFIKMVSRRADPPSMASQELIRVLVAETESLFVRLRAEDRLRRLSNEQRVILDTVGVGIAYVKNRKLVWANSACEAMLGYRPDEVCGMETAALYASREDYDRVGREGYAQLGKGGIYIWEAQLKRKDGSEFWSSLVGRAVAPGNLDEGTIWMLHDITERRRATEALRASEGRHRSVLTSMAEGVVLQAQDGTIIDCNQSAERILGLRREQMMGRQSVDPRWQAVREDGRAFPGEEHPAMVSLRTGQACHDVIMGLRLPDGSQRWISINAEPMFKPAEKQPHAVVTSFADVTERRQFEARLRQSQKMEAIGHLTGGMAHEFNNILAAVMMNLDLAQVLCAGTEACELLQGMDGSCRRAAGLIKQLLAFTRQSVMQRQPMDLAVAVSSQREMLDRLLGERITLELSTAASLPWVSADRGMIDQVLLNLCLNARDAMKEGGQLWLDLAEVEIGERQARAQEGAKSGRYVCLSVADTGCGMGERTLKRLFEPFFTTKDIGQGTGLGLATVRGIVQQHGGWVEVDSRVGKGSTFRVYLPALARTQAAPPVSPRQALVSGQGTILVVEDEPMLRTTSRKLLARAGYMVLEAAEGQEALALWQQKRSEIDLLFTDMVMPGELNGLQLAERLLAEKPGLKVIITSGYHTDLPNLPQLPETSIVYVPKPCSPGDLTALIRKCLSGGCATDEIPEPKE